MKAAVATLLLLGIMAAGWGKGAQPGAAAGAGAQTLAAVSPRLTLHTVTLPALPKWVNRKFRAECYNGHCSRDGVGIEANGDILVAVGDVECCYLYGLVRFDPRRRRWVPGGIINPKAPPSLCQFSCFAMPPFLPAGRAVWVINGWSGSADRARFSNGWASATRVVRGSRGRWGVANVLLAGRLGRVWVVGSTRPVCVAANAATFVCGRSLIGPAGRRSRRVRAIRASQSGTATDATVGPGGSLWLLVPRFRHCAHASCRRSALIRYDPTKRRFTRYTIPARLWPDIGALGGGENNGWVYAEPRGTVWIVAAVNRGVRVIRFHHGSFSSRIVRFPGLRVNVRPPMDRNGDIWYCDESAHTVNAVDALTGQRTTLRNRRETSLLEDMHGRMWGVKGDLTAWSSC